MNVLDRHKKCTWSSSNSTHKIRVEKTWKLRDLLDFVVADARRADPHPLARAVYQRAHGLKVDVPATLRNVVSVADAVSEGRAATTDITSLCHKTEISRKLSNS